jgi:UDP-N-acetylglucosamine acyltransferase
MIHPQAFVSPEAKLGENVTVMPFAYISGKVEIGAGTWVGPNASILDGATIGENCKIFPGAVISAIPQDLKYNGEDTTTIIGNNTTIRECVTINRGTIDKYTTKVGSNCLLMAYVHVAHDCCLGDNIILANSVNLAGHVTIEDWVILEGLAAVQQFVTIGAHAFITGGSLVRKNVPPFVKAAREPLSYMGINAVGLKRRGYSIEQVQQIEDIYRTIYVRGYNISNAISIVELEAPSSAEKNQILDFISKSSNGIIRGFTNAT